MTLRADEWSELGKRRSAEADDAFVLAEERVKQQVAELLHGRIQSRLLITSFKIGQCLQMLPADPERAASLLQQVRQDVEEIRERDVRHVSHLLHPSVLHVGLVSALRSLARQFDGHFRTYIRTDAAVARLDRSEAAGLSPAWRLICYRIVEECLNNAYFHAAPRNVNIQLRIVSGPQLELSVADDGRGFDPDATTPGLGLQAMSGRAAQVSGTIQIDSRPQAGTIITARLPMPVPLQASPTGGTFSS